MLTPSRSTQFLLPFFLAIVIGLISPAWSQSTLRVGGYVQNINPEKLPVPVNGGFVQQMADTIHDPLAARTLVIESGPNIIAVTVVDSCLIPRDLIDRAKQLASDKTKIPPEQMLVSATHAHSVPAVQGIHGSEAAPEYVDQLTRQIAESIIKAHENLQPAQVGWAKQTLDKYIYCRRWLMKPGTAQTIPFTGRESNHVQMNPGHGNPNKLSQTGPVDTDVMVLAFQKPTGEPLAILGNFNTHYAGAKPLSSDYFGHFCRNIGQRLGADDTFVALMSNGTSGDANCVDFSQSEAIPFTALDVADAVMQKAKEAYDSIQHWNSEINIAMHQSTLTLDVRMPSDAEVQAAKTVTAPWISHRLPQSVEEVYQRETILLSEMPPTREVILQTIRIGEFAITSTPCEVYGETGLRIKQNSPFAFTMNIGWANDYLGYLPPPEQHKLGGYTTWRARSSCLEIDAEPKVYDRLIEMLNAMK